MENLFFKYMSDRSEMPPKRETEQIHNKPVITISREYGCPAERITEKLTSTIMVKNKAVGRDQNWRWVSKEVIEAAAKKLKMTPSLVNELSKKSETGFFDSMAMFFSDMFYPSDGKIQNTIAGFIHKTAMEGHVVILGRGSEVITHSFINSIHIKLYAPLDWRSEVVSINEGLTISAAKKKCEDTDARREKFRNFFKENKESKGFYDVMFNCQELSDDEIIEMILILAETRGFV